MLCGMGEARIPRTFWIYLGSRFCAATSMTLLRAAIAWHVFEITRSAFYLGLVGLVQFVPVITLTLLGGAVADAYDRRTIMRLAQIPMIACGALLYFATQREVTSLPLLYTAILLISISFCFDSPARQALVPSLVPLEAFPRAVTYASTAQALAFASGPAIGGMLIAQGGVGPAYAAYGVLVALNLLGLNFVRPVRDVGERRAPSWRAVREGIAFVRRSPMIWGCMTLDMFAVIFGGATALLPIFATDILHVGARGYGLLSSSLEIGALSSALVMMIRPTTVKAVAR